MISIRISLMVLLMSSILLFSDCSKQSVIKPPIKDVDIEYQAFEVDVSKGASIKLESGTNILIPKNIFVDKKNNPIKGNVEITYREFHNAIDVLIAGIPLTYDSAGIEMDFETAGMFEIYGYKNGKPIFIKEGETISIDLASFTGGEGFNNYIWDDTENNWVYIEPSEVTVNEDYSELEESLPDVPPKPVEINELDQSSFLMDFDVNYSEFPELKDFVGIMWEYAGDSTSDNPENNMWIFDENWTSISLHPHAEKEGVYIMYLSNSQKKYQSDIRPVLAGVNYKNAKKEFEKKMEEYNRLVDERKKEEEKMKKVAGFLRTLQIGGFGLFNCDKYYITQNPVRMAVTFDFDNEAKVRRENQIIFHLTAEDRAFRQVNVDVKHFLFNPLESNKLISILPDNKIAVFTNTDFQNLIQETSTENNSNLGEQTITLKTLDENVETPEDFNNIINDI